MPTLRVLEYVSCHWWLSVVPSPPLSAPSPPPKPLRSSTPCLTHLSTVPIAEL